MINLSPIILSILILTELYSQTQALPCTDSHLGSKDMSRNWTSLAQFKHEYLKGNLSALRVSQPYLVPRLDTHFDRSDIFLRRDESDRFECLYKTAGGEFTVHGADSIQEEIVRFSTPIREAFKKGTWLCLCVSAGMGIVLPSLAAYLERSHRGEPKGLLVLEQDPGLLCAGLCMYDYRAVLLSGRILFALGPNLGDALRQILSDHHLEILESDQIHTAPGYQVNDPERKDDYEYALKVFHNEHAKRREGYQTLLRKAEEHWSAPRAEIQRVWTHITDDRASGAILTGLSEGFGALALESKALRFKDRLFTRFHRCVYDVFSFLPDLLLGINHSSNYTASFAQEIPVPRLIWFVDDPATTVDVPFHPLDRVAAVSDTFFPEIKRRGGKTIGVVQAASASHFEKPALHPEWKHNVSYVGSVSDFSSILNAMDKNTRRRVETIVSMQIAQPMRPLADLLAAHPIDPAIQTELAENLRKILPKTRMMTDEQALMYFLYAEANTRRRVRIMRSLRNQTSLGIYGPSSWQRVLPDERLRRCYLGSINSARELGNLYRRSKINLCVNSLQGFGFVNSRLFDVPAAGGFLAAEWVPGIEDFFEKERELFWFKNIDELRAIIDQALSDDNLRVAVVSRAQTRIENEHTYKHRAERILDFFNESE